MATVLWTGTVLGFLVGILHATAMFRRRLLVVRDKQYLSGFYYGLWTVGLWTLFGAYVLTFWFLGLVGMLLSRQFRRTEVSNP